MRKLDLEVMFFLFLLEEIHDSSHKLTALLFPPWFPLITDKDFHVNIEDIPNGSARCNTKCFYFTMNEVLGFV